MARTVLVTGVCRRFGRRVAGALAADPDIDRVIGVDTAAPPGLARDDDGSPLGRLEFVRVDLRGPDIGRLIATADVDTVVHLGLVNGTAGGRSAAKERNVIGTMRLLAACRSAATVRRLVVRSTTAVYGSSPGAPAVFTEDAEPAEATHHGYEKDAIEIEGYVRGFARRRSDVVTTTLRFADFMGAGVDSSLTRYFSRPVLPTVLGFDPRLQFVHEDDAVEVVCRMAREDHPGVFNVAGDGVLLLSQCARRAGLPVVPVPSPAFRLLGGLARGAGLADFSPEQLALLSHGRVVDTTRLAAVLGGPLKHDTAAAFEDFVRSRGGPRRAARPGGARDLARGGDEAVGAGPAPSSGPGEGPAGAGPALGRPPADPVAFLRRRITGEYQVDEFGFDPELHDKLLLELLRPLYRHWFRVETLGVANVPADSGALVVANHSGTLPLDALMMQVALRDEAGRDVRLLGAHLVYRLPVLGHLARKGGHTLACREDADRLLRGGELVGVFPEGFKGIGKPFSERYRLQRFGRGGFVAAAVRAQVPIVPCAIVGAEEIYPKIGDVPVLARLLGLPYVPITPFFPWLGPLGLIPLPSKWLIEFGEPIRTDEYDPADADDPTLIMDVTDQVRETVQQMLDALRLRRGPAFAG